MGQPYRVGADLSNDIEILPDMGFADSAIASRPILMLGHAVQRRLFAVEEKPPVRRHLNGAEACVDGYFVGRMSLNLEHSPKGVQRRMTQAIPQEWMIHSERYGRMNRPLRASRQSTGFII